MIGKFRSAFYSVLGTEEANSSEGIPPILSGSRTQQKYPYGRPSFLSLKTSDEIQVASDHSVRPILVPKDTLPRSAGYAETINAGKSLRNEDQATVYKSSIGSGDNAVDYTYYGIFDGHAGPDTAIAASKELHHVLSARLEEISEHFLSINDQGPPIDSLIIGALESAFIDMDASIGSDKEAYNLPGGCTVLVALFILNKVFVANAGDSRAVLVRSEGVYPMSFDFTPVSERQRLQKLGGLKPELLGTEYTRLDYARKLHERDIGSKVLYRDAHMTGWSYKVIKESDLKFPVVYGEGKRSRLLATIGVTRGFGDHDLRAQSREKTSSIFIKPFLSPQPEVRVFDLAGSGPGDVLVLGTDGLWDVVSNEAMGAIVRRGSGLEAVESRYRFVSIAQELVMTARGKLLEYSWTQSDNSPATIDDISVFVIPLDLKSTPRDARSSLPTTPTKSDEISE